MNKKWFLLLFLLLIPIIFLSGCINQDECKTDMDCKSFQACVREESGRNICVDRMPTPTECTTDIDCLTKYSGCSAYCGNDGNCVVACPDPKYVCEQSGGQWMHETMSYACCCLKECLDMGWSQMPYHMPLCECCLREG